MSFLSVRNSLVPRCRDHASIPSPPLRILRPPLLPDEPHRPDQQRRGREPPLHAEPTVRLVNAMGVVPRRS